MADGYYSFGEYVNTIALRELVFPSYHRVRTVAKESCVNVQRLFRQSETGKMFAHSCHWEISDADYTFP